MILVGAVLLAIFVLSPPWSFVVVAGAVAIEAAEVWVLVRWSQRRRISMGAETLVGETGVVVDPLRPEGRVRVQGELWRARCRGEALPGDAVRVVGLDGLTLEVERI